MAELIITAPVGGWAAGLDEVPDPVFAERMLGDGIAIHPTGSTVHAPCDGTVIGLHPAGHAVTIRHAAGAEILVHVGLDTVALAGKGFRALVAEGAAVSNGDPLIEVDLDAVAQAATSLVTPVIVTNGDAFRIVRRTIGKPVGSGEDLMTLTAIATEAREAAGGETHRRAVTVPLAHGIHARPAARIGDAARRFDAEVEIVAGDRRANARSAVALMALALRQGDGAVIEARGPDAAQAAAALAGLIESGMGETPGAPPPLPAILPARLPAGAIGGVTAAPGLAIGTAVWLAEEATAVARDAVDPAAEIAALAAALDRVRAQIRETAGRGGEPQREILEAHLAFLDDDALLGVADEHIAAGRSAGFAWNQAIEAQAAALRNIDDSRFAERAGDLEDLDLQVQRALAGRDPAGQRFAPGTILLAEDLLPSQLIGLDSAQVAGVVLAKGGATAHVAILAASKGLPMLVATGAALTAVGNGTTLMLDADAGLVHVAPSPEALEGHRERLAHLRAGKAAALASAQEPCRTADGTRIEIFANLGSLEDAAAAAARGAEGSGLVRTEFLFVGANAPSENEQHAAYQAIVDALSARPVIFRLLDIGGDKPAPWLGIAPEANPMLGQRGVRVLLARPELLDTQLRAILRAQPAGQCRIMVPMVSGLDELRAVRAAVRRITPDPVQLGAMIETPAAAATADLIAAEADFLSIGTNDLTQYVLAMDRENAAVAGAVDALHPAVLRLIAHSCDGGTRHRRTVGVCGGLASDPLGIPLLLGLGVTELSTTPAFVPEAKALVRRLDLARCRTLASEALDSGSAAQTRALVRTYLEELN